MADEGSPVASRFSAAGPALGYLAQVDYALLAMLGRMDDEDSFSTSIETLDDIVFHHADTDNATEKWQSKHSIDASRSLSDASADLWKTIHNWIVEPGGNGGRLVLLSTAQAGTNASRLRAGKDRDVDSALVGLERTARESKSETSKPYYDAFLALSPQERKALVERVEIIDEAATVANIGEDLARAVRKSVVARRRPALVQRLRGWWHVRVIAHLDAVARGRPDRITVAELEDQLLGIADSLRDENLPIDVLGFPEPDEEEVSDDDRIFVAQLRLVAMASGRLRRCIYDHNRAFAQRSIWQRDQLLEIGELARYDRELIEAWESLFLPLSDDPGAEITEATLRKQALERFGQLDASALTPIRRDVRAGFIARGSLHVIADRLEIGWHPSWLEHLQHRLPEVRDVSEVPAA
jgi:hypothetical protein